MFHWRLFNNLKVLQQISLPLESASIAQWLEPRSSDPAVVGSGPGWGGHNVPAILRSRTSWQIKAVPGTSKIALNLPFNKSTKFL